MDYFFGPFWTFSLYGKEQLNGVGTTRLNKELGLGELNPSITDMHQVRYTSDAFVS